jgi:hypothetical protein
MKPLNPAVDTYISGLPAEKQEPMRQLRATIHAAAPDADEVITYKMPGFKAGKAFLVSYDAFKAETRRRLPRRPDVRARPRTGALTPWKAAARPRGSRRPRGRSRPAQPGRASRGTAAPARPPS